MPTIKDVVVRKPDDDEKTQCQAWPIWTCDPSEFDWDYTQSETCLIIEGQVSVTDRPAGEESVSFGPGDLVEFPVNLQCIWKITKPVRKHYNFS
jgi:uncharacterized cupin superfamily protein